MWLNHGNALLGIGRATDACQSYRRAIELNPELIEAYAMLGDTLVAIGQLDDAATSYRQLLEIKPDSSEVYYKLGNIFIELRKFDDAVISYNRAISIKPEFVDAYFNLGRTFHIIKNMESAVSTYRRAIEINPVFVEAHFNLGSVFFDLGEFKSAEASFRSALDIRSDFAEAQVALGNSLTSLGKFDDAVESIRLGLNINPNYFEGHGCMGNALTGMGELHGAVKSWRRALEINPENVDVLSNLLFLSNYLSDQPAIKMLSDAKLFGELVARKARPYSSWKNAARSDRCLRIGLVSGDMRNHPVGFFLKGVLEALASNAAGRLEINAYPTLHQTDAFSEQIQTYCHVWRPVVATSDEEFAHRIYEDGIDILIDLSGHTSHNRLAVFAWKPAPVQVSWLGYFATTGVKAIDYLIADSWTLTENEESNFTEKIWRLPETRLCFTPPDVSIPVSPLPALANGYITFGCFNDLAKMSDAVVVVWTRVLTAVPDRRLFLKATQLGNASVDHRVIHRFAAHGIGADRLILEGPSPRDEYLACYHRVDIALDPFPYTGGATSAESLWMGVPVLTLTGKSFLSRQGVGLLMNAGLPEWVAADTHDYVIRAVSHATDLQGLSALRNRLRQQVAMSPIFDARRFSSHFETALRDMWTKWCDQQQQG